MSVSFWTLKAFPLHKHFPYLFQQNCSLPFFTFSSLPWSLHIQHLSLILKLLWLNLGVIIFFSCPSPSPAKSRVAVAVAVADQVFSSISRMKIVTHKKKDPTGWHTIVFGGSKGISEDSLPLPLQLFSSCIFSPIFSSFPLPIFSVSLSLFSLTYLLPLYSPPYA